MKLVIFGLTLSSSWGNGHATIWRGLLRALTARKHSIVFFERDVPYYASHRDLTEMEGVELKLYPDWDSVRHYAERSLRDADAAIVTSYCPDALKAGDIVLSSRAGLKAFYDLDAPVTLKALASGKDVFYVGPRGLKDFDLVLSYTGGVVLKELRRRLGAKKAVPLYGSVDPEVHKPVQAKPEFKCDLSYLGTYAEDRQDALSRLFIEASRQLPEKKFIIGGSLYPEGFPWTNNIYYLKHVAPYDHPSFYSSSSFTLNVTREAMAEMGYCPSGRLFEAAACGVPILSDEWKGLDSFFKPGEEIMIVKETKDVADALYMTEGERGRMARAARERALTEHTADKRALEFEDILYDAADAVMYESALTEE